MCRLISMDDIRQAYADMAGTDDSELLELVLIETTERESNDV